MRICIWATALLTLGVAAASAPHASAQRVSDTEVAQNQKSVSLEVTVSQVDADRDRVIVTGDDGRTYTVDTYQSKIVLRDTDHAGQTGDLVPGMRLHVSGSTLSRDLIEADRVVVLPYKSVRPTLPALGRAPVAQDPRVTLRGTVQSVDDRRGAFVVQVNDHTRKVFLSDRTELRDLSDDGGDRVPVRPGDRVTVVGALQEDGTVQATLLTPRRLDDTTATDVRPVPDSDPASRRDPRRGRTLLGRVSKESDYFSRDIKIRLSGDREITVHVPKNASIHEGGRSISIHDVKDDRMVRVSGDYQNDDFRATQIDVLSDSEADRAAF